jgi:hypothetical protein
MDPDNLARGSVLMPVGAILTQAALFLVAAFPGPEGDRSVQALLGLSRASERALRPGTATLLVFTRAGCRYCEEFDEEVLPVLVREFGDALVVERRAAPAGLPSPTIIVGGRERSVFPGLPPTSELRQAVVLALRKESHEPSVLSQSR